ncbi:MAG: hypothetical protein AB9844_12610 [Clostridiaceae bacterium]
MDYYAILYYATPFIFAVIAIFFFLLLKDHMKNHSEDKQRH